MSVILLAGNTKKKRRGGIKTRTTTVRRHKRRKPSGGVTIVKEHERRLQNLPQIFIASNRPLNYYEYYRAVSSAPRSVYQDVIFPAGSYKILSTDIGLPKEFAVVITEVSVEDIEWAEHEPLQLFSRVPKFRKLYKAGYQLGKEIPPIKVYGKRTRSEKYKVYDGHARLEAARAEGHKKILAEVTLVHSDGQSVHFIKKR